MQLASSNRIRLEALTTVGHILHHLRENDVVDGELYDELFEELTDIIMSAITRSHWKDHY